jgi:hypothetical protein
MSTVEFQPELGARCSENVILARTITSGNKDQWRGVTSDTIAQNLLLFIDDNATTDDIRKNGNDADNDEEDARFYDE